MLKLANNHSLIYQRLKIKPQELIRFCQENFISELAVFGSILRDNFNPKSDIDFLVTYSPLATRGLLEKIILKEKLEKMCDRPVDLEEIWTVIKLNLPTLHQYIYPLLPSNK